jgi:hypothetical protein
MGKIEERINILRQEIAETCEKAGRDPKEVKLVVVTKSADIESIKEVISLGIDELAENRVQQLKKVAGQVEEYLGEKAGKGNLPARINWHMIGHLQRNKVKQVLPIASLIHSVDTLRLSEEVNSAAAKLDICARVLLQVNTSQEPQKYGVPVGAAIHLADEMRRLKHIKLAGIMTMAPLTKKQDLIRSCFTRARELFLEMQGEKIGGADFTELSMGMSSDYKIAIEEGATILRIGSAIFAG